MLGFMSRSRVVGCDGVGCCCLFVSWPREGELEVWFGIGRGRGDETWHRDCEGGV